MYYEIVEDPDQSGLWRWYGYDEIGNVVIRSYECFHDEVAAAQSLTDYLSKDELEREEWKKTNDDGNIRYTKGKLVIYKAVTRWNVSCLKDVIFASPQEVLEAIKEAAR